VKKTSLFIIIFLFVITLLACGGLTTTKEQIGYEEGFLGAYNETLNVEMIKYIDPTASSNLAKLTGITGETLDDNRWIRGYKNDLNIQVSYIMTGSGDTFLTQWSGLMATGDLPDIFQVDYADYQELLENDFIWDMTDYYEEYASPLLRTIIAEGGEEVLNSVTVDGHIYGVPQVVSQYDSHKYLWIRRDWMQSVGVSQGPQTASDLIELMRLFVEEDPDDNGIDDTYAFSLSNDLWYNLEGFFAMYGTYPDSWIYDDSGDIVLGAIQNEIKTPLQILQTMYNNGWINPEFITLDYTKSKADIANGRAGIFMGAHYNASDFLLPSYNNDPSADWAVFPWPSATGEPVVHQLEMGVRSIIVVNKDFPNPEAAVKMMNYYYEMLYGETGDYETFGNDQVDLIWAMGPFFSYRPSINLIPYQDIKSVLNGDMEASELKGASKDYYESVVIENKYDWRIMFGEVPTHSFVTGGESAGYYLELLANQDIEYFINRYYGAPTESMAIVGQQLGLMALEYFTKAITGEKNTSTDFDAFVQSWLSNGGQTITNEINEKFGD
jgi:putative aldouronate transport system substrate-binding protein